MDDALAAVEGNEGDRPWALRLREALEYWRDAGHLDLAETVAGERVGRFQWLHKARRNPATPEWVRAALELMDAMLGREILASVRGEQEAKAALQDIENAGAAAAAELEPARQRVEWAVARLDAAIAEQPGSSKLNRDLLGGLRAAVKVWRDTGSLKAVWHGQRVEGRDLHGWLYAAQCRSGY